MVYLFYRFIEVKFRNMLFNVFENWEKLLRFKILLLKQSLIVSMHANIKYILKIWSQNIETMIYVMF